MNLKSLTLTTTLSLFLPPIAALTNLTWTGYCPFAIHLAPSADPKSLDLTYTPTTTPINPVMFDGKACVVQIYFEVADDRGDVYMEEIEYKSNKAMSVETKVAWNNAYGPTLYDRVSLPNTNIPVIARNATWNAFPFCIQNPHSFRARYIHIQTKFSDANVQDGFVLEQKARFRFGESKLCTVIDECDEPDIDMKFPACHGIPGKKIWED